MRQARNRATDANPRVINTEPYPYTYASRRVQLCVPSFFCSYFFFCDRILFDWAILKCCNKETLFFRSAERHPLTAHTWDDEIRRTDR